MLFRAEVKVMLKPVVNDPQGLVVKSGLEQLGFSGVSSVRIGKVIQIELEAASEDLARTTVDEMCEKLLRNPVIEDYSLALAVTETA